MKTRIPGFNGGGVSSPPSGSPRLSISDLVVSSDLIKQINYVIETQVYNTFGFMSHLSVIKKLCILLDSLKCSFFITKRSFKLFFHAWQH